MSLLYLSIVCPFLLLHENMPRMYWRVRLIFIFLQTESDFSPVGMAFECD